MGECQTIPVEATDHEGPFFFEPSHTTTIKGKLQHFGIEPRELEDLKSIVQSNYFTPEILLQKVVMMNTDENRKIRWRGVDFGLVNHAKSNVSTMLVTKNGITTLVDPYIQYNSLLDSKHRILFDPFRRGTKLYFTLQNNIYKTTVAQLDFIKWCGEHNIMTFIESKRDKIKEHINSIHDKKKETVSRKRRHILTKKPTSCIRGGITEKFDIITDTPEEMMTDSKQKLDRT